MNATIQLMKKVTLSLMAGSETGIRNLTSSPASFEFIFGVASDGFCPFESMLQDMKKGDKLAISVKNADAHEFFGYIFHDLYQALGLQIMPETALLEIEVASVNDATDREVVQAVAKALSHGGCGGSCGCGC